MCDNKIKEWVEIAVKNQNIVDYTITVQGKTNKDDGYLGNVTFVTVTGKTKCGSNKTLEMVIKSSKESSEFRKRLPVKEAFEKEIYIYDQVIPAFDNLLREKELEHPPEITPECYATRQTGKSELLVLENLKTKDYGLWDRKVPMPFDHIKIILEAYGKLHALSFALKKEKPETYKKLTENNVNIFSEFFIKVNLLDFVWEKFNISKEFLGLPEKSEVLKKIDFDKNDIRYILRDLLFEDPEYHVILHGDCWTNNFLFKFEENSTKPVNVRIIDWQCSGLGSPVIDLSFFLYCCCSKECLENLNGLLEIYHNRLSAELKKFGIDSEEVFCFNTLRKHWRKFSIYGVVLASFILRFSLCEAEEAPDLAEAAEHNENFLDTYYFTLKNENVYLERMKCNLLHYLQNVE